LSSTLMRHARVLMVAVALTVMILAMAPVVANAKTDLDGKAGAALKGDDSGGDGGANEKGGGDGANLDSSKADGAVKGDANNNLLGDTSLNTATNTDQRVDLDNPPLVGGDTKSINEVNSDLLPAKGEAKVDGDAVVDGLIDEGLCVRGALNQNASGCGGGAGTGDGITMTVPDINTSANEILGETTLDGATNTEQRVDLDNPPLVEGETITVNEVNSELVPAKGDANVDAVAQVDGLLEEQVCGRGALNQDAGACGGGGSAGGTGNGIDTDGTDLSGPLANLEETTVDSITNIDQRVNDDPLQANGNTTTNIDVDAPTVPASARAEADANVNVPGLANQDIGVCGTLNAENCGGVAAPAPGSGDGNGSNTVDLDDIAADSDTTIDENVDLDEPRLDGTLNNRNDIVARVVPASAVVDHDGNATLAELLNQELDSCSTLNAGPCGNPASAPGNDAANGTNNGIDLDNILEDINADSGMTIDETLNPDEPRLVGTLDSDTDVDAPSVPVSAKAKLGGNATADELVDQDIGACGTLNAPDCEGDAIPANGSANGTDNDGIDLDELVGGIAVDSDTTIEETVNPNNNPALGGTVGNTNNVVAPFVPASATAELGANVSVPGLVNQSVGACDVLNAENCGGDAAPASSGSDNTGGDGTGGSSLDDSSGTNPDDTSGGPDDDSSGSGNTGAPGGGSDPGSESTDGDAFGSGFPLLGRLLERASGSSSGDSSDELAFATPANSSGSSNSGSANSGSANNSDEPASAANPSDDSTRPLAANQSLGSSIQPLSASSSSDAMVALAAGPSKGGGKASASPGSKINSGELPDTGGVSPLVLIAALLFISGGILLVTGRRRRFDS
jgi:LPXTG-motif cell wall-anchored protein